MQVSLARTAFAALDEIWDWNSRKYGGVHADRYIQLLKSETATLATEYLRGKVVPDRPNLRFATFLKRGARHGHLAVYEITVQTVNVLDYYHTAQDWQSHLERKFPFP